MSDLVERLRADLRGARLDADRHDGWTSYPLYLVEQAADALEAQAGEIERLRRDALRLDWIEKHFYRFTIGRDFDSWYTFDPKFLTPDKRYPEMRAAIDAALAPDVTEIVIDSPQPPT